MICTICQIQAAKLNPNPIGGGGGGAFWPPPCRFFRRASKPIGISRSNFMTFFSQVSRIFCYIIHPGGTCRTDFRDLDTCTCNCSTVTKNGNFCTGFYVIHIHCIQCHVNSRSVYIIITLNYNFDYFFVISLFHTLQR